MNIKIIPLFIALALLSLQKVSASQTPPVSNVPSLFSHIVTFKTLASLTQMGVGGCGLGYATLAVPVGLHIVSRPPSNMILGNLDRELGSFLLVTGGISGVLGIYSIVNSYQHLTRN
jgi:hypothetical protein